MPRNGSGVYSLPEAPFIFDTVISETAMNSDLSDIANGLTQSLAKDGQTVPTANLPMGGYRHTGVTNTSGASSRTEYLSTATAQDGTVLDAGLTAGSSTVYTATLTPAITAYADKQCFRVQFDEACGLNPTINFNSLGAKKLYKNVGGVATQLAANDVPANFIGQLRYDTALDTAAGGFWLMNSPGVSSGSITADSLAASAITLPTNFGLVTSVGSNALTIAVKGEDGNDPSSTNVVKIPFTDQAGDYTVLSITAATSLVVSSGSTLGSTNGVLYGYWVVGFNDSGTFRLGVVNCQTADGPFALDGSLLYSSTAEGGAGGADSAGVIYTGTAVSTKAMVILGYFEATEATAGTWATAPSKTTIYKPAMKRPGDDVQFRRFVVSTTGTGATVYTPATTAPTTSGGNQMLSASYTPMFPNSRLELEWEVYASEDTNTGQSVTAALFRSPGTDAISFDTIVGSANNTSGVIPQSVTAGTLKHSCSENALGTSAITFTIRVGADVGTVRWNGVNGAIIGGTAQKSYLKVTEVRQ